MYLCCIPFKLKLFTLIFYVFFLKDSFNSPDVFKDVLPACQQMQDIVTKVFDNNAEHVLAKFVQYIFEKKLAVCTYCIILTFQIS